MIRKFTEDNKQTILDFAYQHERENLFVIGSFNRPEPFEQNAYFGYFDDDELVGTATYFGRHKSFVVDAQDRDVIRELVDHVVAQGLKVSDVPTFKKYAIPIVERLKEHGMEPKKFSEETVFILEKDKYKPFMEGDASLATEQDIDDIVMIDRYMSGSDPTAEVTDEERIQVVPEYIFIMRKNGMLVSKANIHGFSKHYTQIGGVVTHPEHRGRGCAKRCVSAVCDYWFDKGVQRIILFVANDNVPAQKVYRALGFEPVDEFIIAGYE